MLRTQNQQEHDTAACVSMVPDIAVYRLPHREKQSLCQVTLGTTVHKKFKKMFQHRGGVLAGLLILCTHMNVTPV